MERLQFGARNNMDERKTRLMARNILKQQTPEVEQQKKKKAKGAQEEPVQEEHAKKKSGKSEDAQGEATDGLAEEQMAAPPGERDLPSLAGDLKRKRAPRGAARNVKQKAEGETEADPKVAEPAEAAGEDDVADESAISKPADEGEKEIPAGAVETPDGAMSRRESSRLRMKPVKFREIIPTLGAKLKASEDGKLKGLEAQLPVEVQALEEGHITIGRDRISDVYRRRDKKKPVPPKTDKLPVEDLKEVKPPAIEKKEAKSPTVEKKEAKPPARDAKVPAADRKGEKKEAKSSKDAKSALGDKKEVKVAALEKKESKPSAPEKKEARTPAQEKKEAKPSAPEKKDGKTPSKTPGKDANFAKQPAGERKDAKTPALDKKEGRPPPVERKDTRSPAVEKKGGKSGGSERRDGKSSAAERKDGQTKIAIKVKPPVKAADPAMVDVPLNDSDENGLKAALQVVKRVMKLKEAEPFNAPVNPVALHIPDYFDVIKDPMDLGTIREFLDKGRKYQNTEDVLRDVHLVWSNCRKYNNDTDPVVELMQTVETAFIKHWTAAGLQYVPPKKLAAKALLGYTVSGSEKSGKADQHSQKQSKSQADPKLQSDQQQPAERISSDKKVQNDKKAAAPKEPVEESRPLRQRKPSKAVHFEAVTPPKSKKRSAPVEQVMAESMAREQRVSSKETTGEQRLSGEKHPEQEIAADETGEQSVAPEKGAVKSSLVNKPSEQGGVVDEVLDSKVKTSKRAERAGTRLSKRQKTSKEPASPGKKEEEKLAPIAQEGVEITTPAATGMDDKVELPQVAEVNVVEVATHEVATQENPTIEEGEGEKIQSVASSSGGKTEDEKNPNVVEGEEGAMGSGAADKNEDEIMVDVAEEEKDQILRDKEKTLSAATGQTDDKVSIAADEKSVVVPDEEKVDPGTCDEVVMSLDEQEKRDTTNISVAEQLAIVETSTAVCAAEDEKILVMEEQIKDNVSIPGDDMLGDKIVESTGEKTPVSSDEGRDGKTYNTTDEVAVAEVAADKVTELRSSSTLEKRKEESSRVPDAVQDDKVSHAEKIPGTGEDRSKRDKTGLKIKGERSSSKGREERSSKKGKDHRSHTSEKRKESRSHSSSKGREDRKSHSSRDRGSDGQNAKEKDKVANESFPAGGKEDKRRDDKSSGGDVNVKDDTGKSGATKKDDAKKDDKSTHSKRDDKPVPSKKDDKSTPSKKDDKSAPPKKDDKAAPPKKDDKSKRINGTQHHREDCPCVVCKGRRRKLAGIANAERKEKRKLLAMQEGGNKKSKLPMREQKQLMEASQKDGKALINNDEIDGWEADDHFGELFDGDACDPSEAENVRFYPASYKLPPRKISPMVYNMSTTLFGSSPASLWSKRPLLQFRPPQTAKSPLFLEVCSLARCKAT